MTDVVLDWSAARPDPALVRQHAVGVCRYLGDGSMAHAFNLTIHERDQLWDAGLSIALVWEREAKRMDGGFLAGFRDSQVASRQADELGFPADRPIYFANDQNVQHDERHFAYMAGAQHASSRPVGAYGSAAFLEGCRAGLDVRYLWHVSTWGPRLEGLTLEQMANIPPPIQGTDVNHTRADDWGQWERELAPTLPPAPQPSEPSGLPTGADLLAAGTQFLGAPYSTMNGRTNPKASGFADCSGFVYASLRELGITPGGNVSTTLEVWAVNNGGSYITREAALYTPGCGIAIWGAGSNGHIALGVGDGNRELGTPSAEGRKVGYSRFDARGGRNNYTRWFTWPGIDHLGTSQAASTIGDDVASYMYILEPADGMVAYTGWVQADGTGYVWCDDLMMQDFRNRAAFVKGQFFEQRVTNVGICQTLAARAGART